MSYAVRRVVDPSTAPNSSGEPPTTATVLDYICLFTHDLRRKQKRWQDGKLKYHTFNKRIMVYDDRGNFIGDAHWHGGGDLEEGEELELDRGAAIVQVADCVGSREQDLTEILDKRVREVEKRRNLAAAKTPQSSRAGAQSRQQEQPHFQVSHRSLSSIVPSPGPIGRAAISDRSPFEARKAEGAPPAKKRRVSPSPPSKTGFAQSLFGARLNLGGSGAMASLKMRALKERTNLQRKVDEGDKGQSSDGDEDVVIVDERRKKVVVKKSRYSTALSAVSTTVNDGPRPVVRQILTPVHDKDKLATDSTSKRVEEAQVEDRSDTVNGNSDMTLDTTPGLQAAAKLCETRTSAKPAGGHKQAARKTTPAHSKAQVSTTAAARKATPEPPADVIAIESSPEAKPQRTANKNSERRPKVAANVPTVELPRPTSPPKPPERRTELRIKSRQRRGLLMMSERRQGLQRQPASATATSNVRAAETAPDNGAEESTSPEVQVQRNDEEPPGHESEEPDEEQTITATPEPSPPRRNNASEVVSESESDVPSAKSNQNKKLLEEAETSSVSDEEVKPSRKRQRIASKRSTSRQLPSESESTESSPRQVRRKTKATVRNEPDLSADEDTRAHAPPKTTRRSQIQRSESPEVDSSSDKDSDQPPPRQMRRTRTKRESVPPAAEKTDEPKGPRITRMARKSVKCKEIFGFIPPDSELDLVPAAFAMATERIGTVGRPPGVPNRLPGITVTRRPELVTSVVQAPPRPAENKNVEVAGDLSSESGVREKSSSEPPLEETIHEDSTIVNPEPGLLGKTESIVAEPVREASPLERNTVTDQAITSKPTIINPATRGKKAARKQDAAGQAPQTIVPFEAPGQVRPPREKQALPKKMDQNLPGFTSANGGAWSKHAEDLLGMTRPTGKKSYR